MTLPPTCSTRLLSLLLAAAVLLPGSARAGQVYSSGSLPTSQVDVEVDSWLETCPPTGLVPLKLKIRNRTDSAHTWTITSQTGNRARSSASLTVEAGQTGERMFYAPVLSHPQSFSYSNSLSLMIAGHGADTGPIGALHGSSGSYGRDRTDYVGMSARLHALGWSALEGKLSSGSDPKVLDGSKVEMNAAPEDWRGYSGLDQLWMADSEWTSMSPASRTALLEWVAMGGKTYVLCRSATPDQLNALGFPPGEGAGRQVGAGYVTAMEWNGTTLPVDLLANNIRIAASDRMRDHLSAYTTSWSLADSVGPMALRTGLIFCFIVVFGLLVGPVNLFLLAPAGRRQRLFWTTPAISLAGSLILLALMVLQDGFGGSGARTVVALLMPEQKRMIITQEQMAKTGVLLGSGFERKDADLMLPLSIRDATGMSGLHRRGWRDDAQENFQVTETETHRSEGWYSSRDVGGHLLRTVRPSRAAVELHPGADAASPPAILSTVETPLKVIFIMDEQRRVWKAEDVGTGEKKTLRASDRAELAQWMKDWSEVRGGPVIKAQLKSMLERPGHIYAEAEDVEKFAVATLDSIRWNDQRLILTGPYVKR